MRHAPSRTPSRLRPATLLLAALALGGCHDLTAPPPSAPPGVPAARSAGDAGAIVVLPEAMHGWSFVQHNPGRACGDTLACRLVTGPATPPLGTGSAELASSYDAPPSLMLAGDTALAHTPLDRVTTLAYSTFRQTADPRNDAAVTLTLSVELDASSQATSDAVLLTHEPSGGVPGAVPAATWQRWDALAGSWWLSRQGAPAIHGADAHPCVRARPCTWAQLLARFPRIALHRTQGAVALAAPRGGDFRGNVDDVVIGVAGAERRFDFELEAPVVEHLLTRDIGEGVVVARLPADSLFRAGTRVEYAFASGPGRAAPIVLLDDTLAAASGRVVMDAPHRLTVVSDTIYSLAGLTPLERHAATLTRALLDAADRVAAARTFNEFVVSELVAGTEPATLARAVELADYLTVDPVRDSAAVRQVEEALAGRELNYGYGGPGSFYAWGSDRGDAPVLGASPSPSAGARHDLRELANPENPLERTKVIYTNGIMTYRGTAFVSAATLAQLMFTRPRFANYYTSVVFFYNPTYSAHMAEYDRAHPCVAAYDRGQGWSSQLAGMVTYAACKGARFSHAVVSADLVESVRARAEIMHEQAPSTTVVTGLAQLVANLRSRSNNSHVLLVGHSEGTILQEQVVQRLPALEGHPLNVANRCLAVLALAPATSRPDYGMDEYHLAGLLARDDIIHVTLPVGWEEIDTPFSRLARDSMSRDRFNVLLALRLATKIHSVTFTYLTGGVAPVVVERLVSLHRECIPGSAELQVSASVVPLGERVTTALAISNQNQRRLLGRQVQLAGAGYFFDQVDSVTFRAMTPYDGQLRIAAFVMQGLIPEAPLRIPLLRPDFAIRETLLWEWVIVGAANGPDGGFSEVPVPTDSWDGGVASCGRQVRRYGSAGNWQDYELRCNRVYTPVFTLPATLPTGRPVLRAEVRYTGVDGENVVSPLTSYYCAGATPCVTSGYVEWIGELGVVARSLPVSPGQ